MGYPYRRQLLEEDLYELMDMLVQRKPNELVYNPYRIVKKPFVDTTTQYHNKLTYLKYLFYKEAKILLLGEAGGYNGLKHSGIAFTSTKILKKHRLFREIRKDIDYDFKIYTENSATIVYGFFEKNPKLFSKCVLFNTFPFHPHNTGELETNRTPSKEEIEEGKKYILQLFKVFDFKEAHGIGKIAFNCLKELRENNDIPDITISKIRHPSYGGKNEFIENLNQIFEIKTDKIEFKNMEDYFR